MNKADRKLAIEIARSGHYGLPGCIHIVCGARFWYVHVLDLILLLQARARGKRVSHEDVPENYTPLTSEYMERERLNVLLRLKNADRIRDLDSTTPEEAKAFLSTNQKFAV